jgi:hypothetical protein
MTAAASSSWRARAELVQRRQVLEERHRERAHVEPVALVEAEAPPQRERRPAAARSDLFGGAPHEVEISDPVAEPGVAVTWARPRRCTAV